MAVEVFRLTTGADPASRILKTSLPQNERRGPLTQAPSVLTTWTIAFVLIVSPFWRVFSQEAETVILRIPSEEVITTLL